jgi:hypothetical protein
MRQSGLSLDEEIAEVEGRLARHRVQLRLLAAEARSHVRMKSAVPVAMVTAVAIGFAASRFMRRPASPPPLRRGPRSTRFLGAIAAALLPPLVRPLQDAAAHWLAERMRRRARA